MSTEYYEECVAQAKSKDDGVAVMVQSDIEESSTEEDGSSSEESESSTEENQRGSRRTSLDSKGSSAATGFASAVSDVKNSSNADPGEPNDEVNFAANVVENNNPQADNDNFAANLDEKSDSWMQEEQEESMNSSASSEADPEHKI